MEMEDSLDEGTANGRDREIGADSVPVDYSSVIESEIQFRAKCPQMQLSTEVKAALHQILIARH